MEFIGVEAPTPPPPAAQWSAAFSKTLPRCPDPLRGTRCVGAQETTVMRNVTRQDNHWLHRSARMVWVKFVRRRGACHCGAFLHELLVLSKLEGKHDRKGCVRIDLHLDWLNGLGAEQLHDVFFFDRLDAICTEQSQDALRRLAIVVHPLGDFLRHGRKLRTQLQVRFETKKLASADQAMASEETNRDGSLVKLHLF